MSDVMNIQNIEQLYQFLNSKGIGELAIRGKDKRFVAFQKIAIQNAGQGQAQQQIQKAINILNKNNNLLQKNANMIANVAKLNQLNVIMNGLNLCATCVGFAIMYAKLDKMSSKMDQVIAKVEKASEKLAKYEYHKVISEHLNMLDKRRRDDKYSLEEMRELVDSEYNVLLMLTEAFLDADTQISEDLIISIYSLASMLSLSIRYFDEEYYYRYKDKMESNNDWHMSHKNWVEGLKALLEDQFVQKVQDYCILQLNLGSTETDAYYISLCDQVKSLIEDIEDNQELIRTLDNPETMTQYRDIINDELRVEIENALKEIEGSLDDERVAEIVDESLRQVACA